MANSSNLFTQTDELTVLQALAQQIVETKSSLQNLKDGFRDNETAFFKCAMALLIFLMQCGFAFLEAGAVRGKNCTNILAKNLLDSLITIIGYWSIGWAFAYGDNSMGWLSPFVGGSEFFGIGVTAHSTFFFQYVFAARASTIISGAVAERCEFATFIVYSIVVSSTVYPILAHWGWSTQGFLKKGIQFDAYSATYLDTAGSGVVHLCGGTIGLVAAYMMGPRIGRFTDHSKGKRKLSLMYGKIRGHSVPFAALGGFILMAGFLAFNGGSISDISKHGSGQAVAKAMINTIMCGAFSALTYLLIHYVRKGKWTVLLTINACLSGMISACAGCNLISPWATIFTGAGAGLIYLGLSLLLLKLQIDDPLDAFAVHAGGGFWGLISVCLFADHGGLVYALVGQFSLANALLQLLWNFLAAVAIITWSCLTMIPIFMVLKRIGKFRVPTEVEIKGIDIRKHGETAYPLDAYGHGWEVDGEEIQAAEDVLNDMAQGHGTSDSNSNGSKANSSVYTKDGWAVIYHDDPIRLRSHKNS